MDAIVLKEISINVQCAMKHAEDIYVAVGSYEIGYAVMFVEENANFTIRFEVVCIPKSRMIAEQLCLFVDVCNSSLRSFGIFCCDIAVNILKPEFRLASPVYFRHTFIRRFISSLEIVRRSSESLRPRCTITSNASSRTMSS